MSITDFQSLAPSELELDELIVKNITELELGKDYEITDGEDYLQAHICERFVKYHTVAKALRNAIHANNINPSMTPEWDLVLEALKELE